MGADEIVRILGTFDAQDFVSVIEEARRLLGMDGTLSTKTQRAVPTSELHTIFRRRASNKHLPPHGRELDAQLARVANRFPDEGWYIYSVRNGRIGVTVYANEEGLGRVCAPFEDQRFEAP